MTPGAPGLQDLLIHEIRNLTYPSLPRVPFELPWIEKLPYDTPLDLCLKLDAELPVPSGSAVAYPPSPRNAGKKDLLQQIILDSETAETSVDGLWHSALRLAFFLLPLCAESARSLIEPGTSKGSDRKSTKVERKLDREIRVNADELDGLPLSRSSHFRPLTLWRNLLKFFISVRNRQLEVPWFLQNWIGSLFRFVWVAPLEPMGALHTCTSHPALRNHLVSRSEATVASIAPSGFRST